MKMMLLKLLRRIDKPSIADLLLLLMATSCSALMRCNNGVRDARAARKGKMRRVLQRRAKDAAGQYSGSEGGDLTDQGVMIKSGQPT